MGKRALAITNYTMADIYLRDAPKHMQELHLAGNEVRFTITLDTVSKLAFGIEAHIQYNIPIELAVLSPDFIDTQILQPVKRLATADLKGCANQLAMLAQLSRHDTHDARLHYKKVAGEFVVYDSFRDSPLEFLHSLSQLPLARLQTILEKGFGGNIWTTRPRDNDNPMLTRGQLDELYHLLYSMTIANEINYMEEGEVASVSGKTLNIALDKYMGTYRRVTLIKNRHDIARLFRM